MAAEVSPAVSAVWHLALKIRATIPRGRKKKAVAIAERTKCGDASVTTAKLYWIVLFRPIAR